MAKQTFSMALTNATDAEFRAWGSTLGGVISALMTKATQAGEVNWSTVSKPTGSGVSAGFEVYYFSDSLHATYPLYLKFEYGASTFSAAIPALWLTIGKAVDGSGNVSSVIFPRTQVMSLNTNSSTPATCYASSNTGSALAIALQPTVVDRCFPLVIERSLDSLGAPTGAGFVIQYSLYGGTAAVCKAASYQNATLNSLLKGMFFIPFNLQSNVSLAFGTNNPFFTGTVINPDGVAWVPRCAVGVAQANLGAGQVVTAMYSGNDYLGLGSGVTLCDAAGQAFSSMAIIWM